MAAKTLIDLPLELLRDLIATYLSTEDLGSLRLTSRGIERYLFDSFAKEFFAKKQFMLSTHSLQTLVDISKHVALNKWVKHVVIGLERFKMEEGPVDHDMSRIEKYRKGQADQFVLLATGGDRKLLSEAFRNLPNLETVGIRDYSASGRLRDNDQRWRSYGVPTILKETGMHLRCTTLGYQNDTDESRFGSRAFSVILSALADSSITQDIEIEVILRSRGNGLSGFAFVVPDHAKMQNALAKLRKLLLTLNLRDADVSSMDSRIFTSTMIAIDTGFVMDFLGHTSNLRHLRLNFQGLTGEGLLTRLSQPEPSSIFLPCLERFDIGMVSVEPAVLLSTLNRFSSTLQEVNFWKVSLKVSSPYPLSKSTPSAWGYFLRQVIDMSSLKLERMSIGCIAQLHPNHSTLAVKFRSSNQSKKFSDISIRKIDKIDKNAKQSLKELIDDLYLDIAEPESSDEGEESDHDSDVSMGDGEDDEEDEEE